MSYCSLIHDPRFPTLMHDVPAVGTPMLSDAGLGARVRAETLPYDDMEDSPLDAIFTRPPPELYQPQQQNLTEQLGISEEPSGESRQTPPATPSTATSVPLGPRGVRPNSRDCDRWPRLVHCASDPHAACLVSLIGWHRGTCSERRHCGRTSSQEAAAGSLKRLSERSSGYFEGGAADGFPMFLVVQSAASGRGHPCIHPSLSGIEILKSPNQPRHLVRSTSCARATFLVSALFAGTGTVRATDPCMYLRQAALAGPSLDQGLLTQ